MKLIIDCSNGTTTTEETTVEETNELAQGALVEAWIVLRNQRNARLASCDWTVLSDTPTSTAAWKTYRQALRDLPANTTDPFNPVWPTPPS